MRAITFSAEDLQALAHERYHHPDPRVQRKMEVLWLKSHQLPHDDIAAYAGVCRRTVQRYLDEYLEGGLPRLRQCRWHQPQSALTEHGASLEEHFLAHPPRSAKQAQAVIEQRTGIRRGLTQVRRFLKEGLGLGWRKAGSIPVPPKKPIPEHARDQAFFLEKTLEPRRPAGPAAGVLGVRRPLRFRPLPGLFVVLGGAVRAAGFGPQSLQRTGGAGR